MQVFLAFKISKLQITIKLKSEGKLLETGLQKVSCYIQPTRYFFMPINFFESMCLCVQLELIMYVLSRERQALFFHFIFLVLAT